MIGDVFARPERCGRVVASLCIVGLCAFGFSIWSSLSEALADDEQSQTTSCARVDLEAVVDEAGAALRQLNHENKPKFQKQLRQLKEKNGWSHEAFLKKAAPFVRDETITVYNQKTMGLLNEISTLGEEGAEAAVANCVLLKELRARMGVLVETQNEKWSYMFAKLEKALK